ncbi:replicative DNA helicase [Methylobacterium nodulans]|uniref:DNA 5'-3' helicase n=1 Tax=Methylobacterium nodulans (strain LMG 21967 / CNCM I-2342 / ORS 2060) TaxID=460265 RepID=B8IIT5_METNO|nr:DnaB-like helicase C-terminal domain-containing protein [Methylobacterium nodulans]ACL61730.1 DnaB domain protein helicase domain protein [Methylobacterium nodulans ORS 2060]
MRRQGNVIPFQGIGGGQNEAPPLPHSIDVEQALLGAVLHNNDVMAEVASIVTPEHFFEALHGQIWREMAAMIAQGLPCTPITAKAYIGDKEVDEDLTLGAYLRELAVQATTVNAKGYALIVRDLAARRRIIQAAEQAADRARNEGIESSSDSIVDDIEAAMLDCRADEGSDHLAGMYGDEAAQWLLDRVEAKRNGTLEDEAIPTGLPVIDALTKGGYRRGELWLIAGRPGMGKSVVLTSFSRRAAQKAGTLVYQLEITREQQVARYLTDIAWDRQGAIEFGDVMQATRLSDADMYRLHWAKSQYDGLPLRLEVGNDITLPKIVHGIRAERRRMARRGHKLGVVFIDYLDFIKSPDRYKGNRNLEISEIANGLKTVAKAEDVCIVLLVQLNRQTEKQERTDRRPNLGDLRDSGSLEQAADRVLFLYRDAYYLEEKVKRTGDPDLADRLAKRRNILEVIFGKNRAGPLTTAELFCDVASSRLDALAPGA